MSLLVVEHVALNFGGVEALRDLSLSIAPGTLHGLIGPNGAGTTTAMNVISGLHRPSAGSMTFRGAPFQPKPHQLAALGLARTFQAAATIGSLRAFDNVLLGGYAQTKAGILSSALKLPGAVREDQSLRLRAEQALEQVGYTGPRDAPMAELSTWQRRQLEIARGLLSQPRLMLLDEPAAGLTMAETASLRAPLLRLRGGGPHNTAILLVEHNVPPVFSLCNTITAMADGAVIVHGPHSKVRAHPEVIRSYLRTGCSRSARRGSPACWRTVPWRWRWRASMTATAPTRFCTASTYKSARVTVALFGPNGAGKTTLFNTIIGERRASSGSITWQGERIDGRPIQEIVRAGIGIVPQGRAVLERQTAQDNLLISTTGLHLPRGEF